MPALETTIGFSRGEHPELSWIVGASVFLKTGIGVASLGIDRGPDGANQVIRYYVEREIPNDTVGAIGEFVTHLQTLAAEPMPKFSRPFIF